MPYYYTIGPVKYVENDPIEGTYYCAPDDTVGWIDTRPVTGEITSGFFAFHTRPSHLAGTHTIIGDGSRLEEYHPNLSERSAWEALYGVTTHPTDTLHDMLVRLLTVDADPDGYERCRPLTVDHRGNYEIHLGGHSRIFRAKFRGIHDRLYPNLQRLWKKEIEKSYNEAKNQAEKIRKAKPNDPIGKQIAEKAKNMKGKPSFGDMQEIMAQEIEVHPGKMLTELCRLHKVKKEELMPDGVKIELKKPTTQLYDDFERADLLMGVWTDPQPGDLWLATSKRNWLITDGKAWYDGSIANGLPYKPYGQVYYNNTLSSSNQHISSYNYDRDGNWIGVVSRGNLSDYQCYFGFDYYAGPYITRIVSAGTSHVDIGSTFPYVKTDDFRQDLVVDGSTLQLFINGNLIRVGTDTVIPSGIYTGMETRTNSGSTIMRCEWWSARDLLASDASAILLFSDDASIMMNTKTNEIPFSTTNMSGWWNVDSLTSISHKTNDKVSKLSNCLDNVNEFKQPNESQQPIVISNILNSYPVLRFNASEQQYIYNDTSFTPPVTIFALSRYYGTTRDRVVTAKNNEWSLGHENNKNSVFNFEGYVANSGISTEDWNLYCAIIRGPGENTTIYRNGELLATNQNGTALPDTLSIGGTGSGHYSDCELAELMIFNEALDSDRLYDVHKYFMDRYLDPAPVSVDVENIYASNFSEMGPTDGLVGYYSFDENTIDYSGESNTATWIGTPTYGAGKRNNSAVISSTRYLKSLNSSSSFNNEEFTVSAWVKVTSLPSTVYGSICGTKVSDGGWSLSINPANNILYLRSGNYWLSSSIKIVNNVWIYLTVTRTNDGVVKFYANGDIVQTTSDTVFIPGGDLYIGRGGSIAISEYINGHIDELRYYNRVLGAREVSFLYDTENMDKLINLNSYNGIYVPGGILE